MNKQLLSMAILTAALSMSPMAMADETTQPKERMPMSKILHHLQKEGYNVILKIELEGDAFKAKVFDSKGKAHKLEIASETGKINHPKAQPTHLSIGEAVQKVEEAGYQNIYKISSDDNQYEMKGYDKDNKKVSLDVDAATGKINKEWF